ncbi:MAG: M23 family metallopeptidase [Elusimicrobiota bacterium]
MTRPPSTIRAAAAGAVSILLRSIGVGTGLLLLISSAAGVPAAKMEGDPDWNKYLKRAETLKKFRDEKTLDDKEILSILRKVGVFEKVATKTRRGGHRSFAKDFVKGFRPFKIRVYKGLWRWPLRYGIVSSEYGRRWGRRHKGVDIAADKGDLVRAAAPGEVIFSSDTAKGYGKVIILRHDNELTSLYAHNSELIAKVGQRVRIGAVLAKIGSTGRSTGPHIHFEVRKGRRALDPRKILPKSRF